MWRAWREPAGREGSVCRGECHSGHEIIVETREEFNCERTAASVFVNRSFVMPTLSARPTVLYAANSGSPNFSLRAGMSPPAGDDLPNGSICYGLSYAREEDRLRYASVCC